jgi:hypothetical protein
MLGAHRFYPEEEITQKLDLALERLQDANARQHRARERLVSEPPAESPEHKVSKDPEQELEDALDAGSGPHRVVG